MYYGFTNRKGFYIENCLCEQNCLQKIFFSLKNIKGEIIMKRYQLSVTGPTECDPEVLRELNNPNIPHYGDLWLDFYFGILDKLRKIYKTKNSVFIIPSSGSGGIDSVFASLYGKKGLILDNGTFGRRLVDIASHYLDKVTVIHKEFGQHFEMKEIKETIKKENHDLLAVVHGETSTGMLNPLEDLSEFCKETDILFVVDSISTLGGVNLSVDELGIDFCISASQKALGSLPGLATISISNKGWKRMREEENIPGWYLNLRTWARFEKEWSNWHPFPVTLPVHLFFTLNKALELILEEGLEKRWLRHKKIADIVHSELKSMDISPFIKEKSYCLPTVTAAVLPRNLDSEELQRYMKEKYGILIAGGVGPLRKQIFRVGHMAYSAQEYLVNRVLSGIRNFILQRKN